MSITRGMSTLDEMGAAALKDAQDKVYFDERRRMLQDHVRSERAMNDGQLLHASQRRMLMNEIEHGLRGYGDGAGAFTAREAFVLADKIRFQHPLFDACTVKLHPNVDGWDIVWRMRVPDRERFVQQPAPRGVGSMFVFDGDRVRHVDVGGAGFVRYERVAHIDPRDRAYELARRVRDFVVDMLKHEVDEMLLVDDVRAFDPHDDAKRIR